ncbi:peptide chain release factor N(5)-glutamine methyltransferase [Candidatus Daviesbacteria bacterium]|nr:peptide chain release factor N(5)-glutamine methyltransferase [Candidatus Daviesbacteria bacterium]
MTSSRPFQYINGWVEFYKLKFKVTPDVLIPRPETELLVDEVVNRVKSEALRIQNEKSNSALNSLHSALTILDLGTGSGNIAISIAKNLTAHTKSVLASHVRIIATDISAKALKVARQNAKLHGVENKITFLQSNLLSVFNHSAPLTPNSELILVTNLPYIPSSRIPYLDSSVKDFEPLVALDGGEDGFDLYRKLFQQISQQPLRLQLKLIIGEIDYTHGELAVNEALKYFPHAKVEVKTDLSHKQRILKISF